MTDFLNDLSTAVNKDILAELNFANNTVAEFNSWINGSNFKINFTVFHVNIRSLNKNGNALYNLLLTLDLSFDVIVLTEIWNVNLDLCKNLFNGYTFYFDVPADSTVGGVGVYVRNCYSCNILNTFKITSSEVNRVENIWIEILDNNNIYTLGAIYRHPNQNINDFSKLLEQNLCQLANSRHSCVIAGDLNIDLCKYSTHGPTKDYINNLLSNNFLPHIIMPTHFIDNSSTIIDHIYYKPGNQHNIVVNSGNLWWSVTDHLPNYIIIQTDKTMKKELPRPLIRLHSPRNVQTFQSSVSSIDWSDLYYCQDVNEAYNKLVTRLNKSYEDSFPLTKLSRKCAHDKKWITSGIKASVKMKSKLYKKWRESSNVIDGEKFKNYRRIFKSVCKEAENKFYRELFDTKCNSIKQLWSNLNRTFSLSKSKNNINIPKLSINNVDVTDPKQICNSLNSYFCAVGSNLASKITTTQKEFKQYLGKQILSSMVCEPVTRSEIINIVHAFKDGKSPGPDNIGPKLLKSILNDLTDPLVYICNLSFTTGCVPDSLKIAKVIPIFKKGDVANPGNYRPISLLSIFHKLLEKLMFKRVYSFFHKFTVLYQYQFGFRQYHSTSLALIELCDNLYSHLDQHEVVIGMYFDLQKAFDTVDHRILLEKLYNYGIRGIVHDWFRNYLSNRRQFVAINNIDSNLGNVNCGVPQGSVLGPLLFLIYVNDIANASPNSDIRLFADDTNVFVFGKSLSETNLKAEKVVNELDQWFLANKLSLSIDKTCYSIFGCHDIISKHSNNLKLNDTVITKVDRCKYLGVMIDNDLKWQSHIDLIYSRLLKFTGIFYKLRCYLSVDVLRLLYFAFVHSQILYGIEVYANTCHAQLHKLCVLNNKILRILQNKPPRTPVVQLYQSYNTLPIPKLHHFQLLCLVFKYLNHNRKLPSIFANFFTRNSEIHTHNTRSANDLHLSCVNSLRGVRCVKFKASLLWNNLPTKLKEIKNLSIFKKQLTNFLLFEDASD